MSALFRTNNTLQVPSALHAALSVKIGQAKVSQASGEKRTFQNLGESVVYHMVNYYREIIK